MDHRTDPKGPAPVDLPPADRPLPDLDGGPYDLEFFFDAGCPFAWQTSVWMRRVAELRGIRIGWRFFSLWYVNEGTDQPRAMRDAQARGLAFHRVAAATRDAHGNDAVGQLYRLWGERYWYVEADGDLGDRLVARAVDIDIADLLGDIGLPERLARAGDDSSRDAVIEAETAEALRRTGPDVGTPIITYDPPHGNSLFGPVISEVPADDATAVALYDALRTFADFPGFSELKRTHRPPLDLPLLAS